MLMHDRFDYFPRGINEVFDEIEQRHQELPDMVIEPTLAMYLSTPSYIFVSPKHPELAERIETGLRRMIEDGSFDEIFWKFHGENIKKADLNNRKIITLNNPLLTPETPFNEKQLWYNPCTDTQ